MEREVYEAPEIEVIKFDTKDVMEVSGPEMPIGDLEY